MSKAPLQDIPEQGSFFKFKKSEQIKKPRVRGKIPPLWTENKAKLVERYLLYFVYITKHGTYIDGFAGPQNPEKEESWAAKLVLANEPRWLTYFYLFDQDPDKIAYLNALKQFQPPRNAEKREKKRKIEIKQGDFNVLVHDLLSSKQIGQKEATFCLLDQRTYECHWSTVEALARHKKAEHKIELFYFLPHIWLARSLTTRKDTEPIKKWWGREDWENLRGLNGLQRADLIVERFKNDLGYAYASHFPIYKEAHGGAVMYYMIHASDHPRAPQLMLKAYQKAVLPKETAEQ